MKATALIQEHEPIGRPKVVTWSITWVAEGNVVESGVRYGTEREAVEMARRCGAQDIQRKEQHDASTLPNGPGHRPGLRLFV